MMPSLIRRTAGLPRIPLAVLGLTLAVVIGSRLVGVAMSTGVAPDVLMRDPSVGETVIAATDADDTAVDADGPEVTGSDPLDPPVIAASSEDLTRIRADISFWGDRFAASPRDFVSATRLAASFIELARATGDVGAYVSADRAVSGALAANADSPVAKGYRGVILVALHKFADARDHAAAVLADQPDDPMALATLGDATLELGDLAQARAAYGRLRIVADSSAARVRLGRLAFIEGRTGAALADANAALRMATEEGLEGNALAWYRYQLGELVLATGDRAAAAAAFDGALEDDPHFYLARGGRARIAAADGRLDDAIADLDAAVAAVPLPDLLARRADLYDLRDGAGDARRATDDRATILLIGRLSGEAEGVYDRTLSLYLATTGIDVADALRLAEAEIAVRKDVYGYDALGWALLANGRAAEADRAMTTALSVGTTDARLQYHAGMAAAAVGDRKRARTYLEEALALDPTFDPVSVARARATLETLR